MPTQGVHAREDVISQRVEGDCIHRERKHEIRLRQENRGRIGCAEIGQDPGNHRCSKQQA